MASTLGKALLTGADTLTTIGNGLTAGFAPVAIGGAAALKDYITGAEGPGYAGYRDAVQANVDRARARAAIPGAETLASILGGGASLYGVGATAAKLGMAGAKAAGRSAMRVAGGSPKTAVTLAGLGAIAPIFAPDAVVDPAAQQVKGNVANAVAPAAAKPKAKEGEYEKIMRAARSMTPEQVMQAMPQASAMRPKAMSPEDQARAALLGIYNGQFANVLANAKETKQPVDPMQLRLYEQRLQNFIDPNGMLTLPQLEE